MVEYWKYNLDTGKALQNTFTFSLLHFSSSHKIYTIATHIFSFLQQKQIKQFLQYDWHSSDLPMVFYFNFVRYQLKENWRSMCLSLILTALQSLKCPI